MVERTFGWKSFVLIRLQHTLHQIQGFCRHVLPVLRRVLYLTLFILELNLVRISAENFFTGKHLIKYAPNAEDVDFSSVPLLVHDLRCNIPRCATPQRQQLSFLNECRQAKISNSQIIVILLWLKQEIFRLQISVNHVILMYITQCTQQVSHAISYQYLRYEKLLFDTSIQLASTDIVKDQMNVLLALIHLK